MLSQRSPPARSRFHSPALFGYEAGAIEENRHNLPAAVAEYTSAVIHPIAIPHHFDSSLGVIDAWLNLPSDAGDSNFRSTAQSFLGSEEANARLIQLATRASTSATGRRRNRARCRGEPRKHGGIDPARQRACCAAPRARVGASIDGSLQPGTRPHLYTG